MIAPATKINESEKAEQLIVLSYEGAPKTMWVPKKIVQKEKKTIEGKKGSIYVLPNRFAKGHNIPNELFVMDLDNFCDTIKEILPDIAPNLEPIVLSFKQSVRLPDDAIKIIRCGFVPLKKGTTVYFISAENIEEFYPTTQSWKLLMNTDFINSDGTPHRPYKSFTFIVNGEVWVWNSGKIIPPESFITDDEDLEW